MNNFLNNYYRDGYVIIPNLIDETICDWLKARADFLVEQADLETIKALFLSRDNGYVNGRYFLDSVHKMHFFIDQNAFDQDGNFKVAKKHVVNKIGHGLHEVDPVFSLFSQMYPIIKLLEQLEVSKPQFVQSMYLFKQPLIGDEVGCHQDETFITPVNGNLTGLWFALEDANIHNGCLWAIPGGHHTKLKSKMVRSLDDQVRMEEYDKSPWPLDQMIPLEVKKGSVIALHGLLPHMSYPNKSEHSRHAYTLHAISGSQKLAAGNWLTADGLDKFVQIESII